MTDRTTWTWQLLDSDDRQVGAPVAEPPAATSRFDAELWLGEAWRALSAAGVRRARLLRDDTVISVVELVEHRW